ncbi:uncharacterized protein IL334_005039 [Kwoniella shivajii]|uniref:Uncharacterized protein n=1 Tax=Kwoniella shivajii TaxID=564305 RepID=A0ABZ1D212_9TREE|nr:hypothetical protein IL334_005039 [Kwoniella shivajii]
MQYYNTPMMGGGGGGIGMGMGGMDPRLQQQMQMQQAQLQPMTNPMAMGGLGYGQAYRQLGYDYTLPTSVYKPEATWGAWDLANAQYNGGRLERSFFDNIVRLLREYQYLKHKHKYQNNLQEPSSASPNSPNFLDKQISSLTNFFANRHLSEDAARDAHRRVYYQAEGADAGNKTLGGAAAYQAYLIWDRDHYSAYHANPSQENRERLVGLAVAELFSLWDRVQPRSSRANTEDAAQYAAATAKYLFDRHYDLPHSHSHRRYGSRHSGYGADNDSDSDDERHQRRRSFHNQSYGLPPNGMGGMQNPMMNQMPMQGGMTGGGPGMMGPQSMGIPGMGMPQPGMGSMGMPGAMGMGAGGGMMGNPMMMNQMGMNGMQGMGMGMGMQPGMMNGMGMPQGMGQGMPGMQGMSGMGMMNGMMQGGPLGGMPGNHGQMGEAQAGPGMHPYTYGGQSGVAYGNQPIDQMGQATFPGGPGRSWYGYGQPRYF